MEKDIQRRNVIDVLRSMDVGAIEVFPIVQKPSVTNTLNARLYKEKAEGMAWKTLIPQHYYKIFFLST